MDASIDAKLQSIEPALEEHMQYEENNIFPALEENLTKVPPLFS